MKYRAIMMLFLTASIILISGVGVARGGPCDKKCRERTRFIYYTAPNTCILFDTKTSEGKMIRGNCMICFDPTGRCFPKLEDTPEYFCVESPTITVKSGRVEQDGACAPLCEPEPKTLYSQAQLFVVIPLIDETPWSRCVAPPGGE